LPENMCIKNLLTERYLSEFFFFGGGNVPPAPCLLRLWTDVLPCCRVLNVQIPLGGGRAQSFHFIHVLYFCLPCLPGGTLLYPARQLCWPSRPLSSAADDGQNVPKVCTPQKQRVIINSRKKTTLRSLRHSTHTKRYNQFYNIFSCMCI